MISVQIRYLQMVEKYPDLSSFTCYVKAVKDQKFSSRTIREWLLKLVPRGDFSLVDLDLILLHLCQVSKTPEDDIWEGKFAPGEAFDP